jgi:putative transposase
MTAYRRHHVPGGTYCFTVNLYDRRSKLRTAAPFHINAWMVLPEHPRGVLTMPDGDENFSARSSRVTKSFVNPYHPFGQHVAKARFVTNQPPL